MSIDDERNANYDGPPIGVPQFPIDEADLEYLEQTLPLICDRATFAHQNGPVDKKLQIQIRKVKNIISDVRWRGLPYSEVGTITAD